MNPTPKYAVGQTVFVLDGRYIAELIIKKVIKVSEGKYRYEFYFFPYGLDENRLHQTAEDCINAFINSVMNEIISAKEDLEYFIQKNRLIVAKQVQTYFDLERVINKLDEIIDQHTTEDEPNT